MAIEKQKTYKKVYEIACRNFLSSDMERQFLRSGVNYEKKEGGFDVHISYFDEIITLSIPLFHFKSSKGVNVTLVTKIIILHYLINAKGTPLKGDFVPYEDIPGLRGYLPVFERRVVKPVLQAFGYDKHAFLEAGIALGGKKGDFGDSSFILSVLPRVPLMFILWEGDEEFPPSLKVLFDPSIPDYLPLEDITVLSKLASTRLIKKVKALYGEDEFYSVEG
ncbi:MAG: DUF3786 domain-containing protein [Syntrophorhabdaceae bacterium]|nr:DUF3786 domain-containing protein [Syntrophorhabdaceae bacterium]